MKSWRQTVLAQYKDRPRLMTLLTAVNEWLSVDADFELFYQTVMDIDTASGIGLNIWGRIVNIPRTVTLTGVPTFGFGEATDRTGFNQGPFYEASIGVTQNFQLDDEVYRQLILAKASYNITNGSTQAINAILMNLFPNRGNAYVIDGRNTMPLGVFGFSEPGDRVGFGQGPFCDLLLSSLPNNMTMTYVFEFVLQPFEIAIVKSGVLPKPTGVTPFWSFS